MLEELPRAAGLLLGIQQVQQPLPRQLLLLHPAVFIRLIYPVCGDPGLGDTVHVLGTDLEFHRLAEGAEHGRMQGLVAVRLGDGDIVVEAAGDGFVEIVNDAEGAVAVVHSPDNNAKSVDVVQIGK